MSGKNGNSINSAPVINRILGKHSTDIEMILRDNICNYVHSVLMDHVQEEYEDQIDKKWKPYINNVVDAQRIAQKSYEDLLNSILTEQQKKEQKCAMFAMMALSLVSGPALSWITGTIETKVFPKYFSNQRVQATKALIEHRVKKTRMPYIIYNRVSDYNQVAAKIFGEFTANVVQKGYIEPLNYQLSQLPDRNAEKSMTYEKLTSFLATTRDNEESDKMASSFNNMLDNALLSEKSRMRKVITKLAWNLKHSSDFGRTVLELLYKRNPRLIGASFEQRKEAARELVRKIIDDYRKLWAQAWLYFGNDPPNTSIDEMSRRIEREIWALWILDQEFKYVEYTMAIPTGEAIAGHITRTKVAGRGDMRFPPKIINRLIDLGVVMPQTLKQMHELNARNQKYTEREAPGVDVDGDVDKQVELEALQNWAQNRKPELLSGQLDHFPRDIPPTRRIY